MKRNLYVLLFWCLICPALLLMYNCDEKRHAAINLSAEVSNYSGCKNLRSSDSTGLYPDSVSCAEFQYFQDSNLLRITHYNAIFNCCIEELHCSISSYKDSIILKEYATLEGGYGCDCVCPYDMVIRIENVKKEAYFLKIIGPYLSNYPEAIEFEIDLTEIASGCHCVYSDY